MQDMKYAVALAFFLHSAPAGAQQLGNALEGLAYARDHCGECHGVEAAKQDFSPNIDAPDFSEVANSPGMTERALAVWLQTSHPTMPDFMIAAEDRDDLIAYIMSLKTVPPQ